MIAANREQAVVVLFWTRAAFAKERAPTGDRHGWCKAGRCRWNAVRPADMREISR
jgi:hypothetical protein